MKIEILTIRVKIQVFKNILPAVHGKFRRNNVQSSRQSQDFLLFKISFFCESGLSRNGTSYRYE
jgi:hypothetical protein